MKKMMIVLSMIVVLTTCFMIHGQTDAKSKVPALNKKSLSVKKGMSVSVSIKNATPKKTMWTVNKAGKKIVTLSKKTKKKVAITGKKRGSATVTAKVTVKGKKAKILKCKVKVQTTTIITTGLEKKREFPGSVKASLDEKGYVKLTWDKVADAYTYVVDRKMGAGDWERLKITASTSLTDREIEPNTKYSYRVRANCVEQTTAYSTAVTITTGEIKASTPGVTTDVTPTITPTITPTPTPGSGSYQAKYHYEVEVLNKFTIYERVPVVLFVKTDNPNPNDYDNVYVSLDCSSDMGGIDYNYEDIQYLEQEETNTTFFNKVNGGWICTAEFYSSGIKNVNIQEFNKEDKSGGRYGTWNTVSTFQIEVHDGDKALQQHCNNIIQTVSDESYNKDGLGEWSTLSGQQKMKRLEAYVRSAMHYPRYGGQSVWGLLPVWVVQENVGASWETGFADCGAANDIVCVLARILGYEAHTHATQINGANHIIAIVTIDGEEYEYDATPWEGGYKEWGYIL